MKIGKAILQIIPMLDPKQLKKAALMSDKEMKAQGEKSGESFSKGFSRKFKAGMIGAGLALTAMLTKAITGSINEAKNNTQKVLNQATAHVKSKEERVMRGEQLGLDELQYTALEQVAVGRGFDAERTRILGQKLNDYTSNESRTINLTDANGERMAVSLGKEIKAQSNYETEGLLSAFQTYLSGLSEENQKSVIGQTFEGRNAIMATAILLDKNLFGNIKKESEELLRSGFQPLTDGLRDSAFGLAKFERALAIGSADANLSNVTGSEAKFKEYLQVMSDSGDALDAWTVKLIDTTISLERLDESLRQKRRDTTSFFIDKPTTERDIQITKNRRNFSSMGFSSADLVKTSTNAGIDPRDGEVSTQIGGTTYTTGGY